MIWDTITNNFKIEWDDIMITMSKYKQLSYNFTKPFVVYKGIRYHLSTVDNQTIIEDGMVELYNLMKKEENKIRKQVKNTTKNYKCIEEFLGVNPSIKIFHVITLK